MTVHFTRRTLIKAVSAIALTQSRGAASAQGAPAFSYPVGLPGRVLGDGFLIRHGYATENVWYNPGWWHAGEDWYLAAGDAAGVAVFAVADGEVVFAGSEYPGLVVIVRHGDDLYSMYGHLDYALAVTTGDAVARGQRIGTILARTDGRAPSHLHFELRTFLTTPEVNGAAPRYGVACGYECPPGPGYWPIDAPEHPSVMGWRNPMHVIGNRAGAPDGAEAIVAATAPEAAEVWLSPEPDAGAEPVATVPLRPGDRYPLLAIDAGPEASQETSAEAYRLWYRVGLSGGESAWVRAALPDFTDTGADGRPSAVRLNFVPGVLAG